MQANALPNPKRLAAVLRHYVTTKPNATYIGCMKSGQVITSNMSPWVEPEAWKFGGAHHATIHWA